MITLLFVFLALKLIGASDAIEMVSYDTQFILAVVCFISDFYFAYKIFFW